MNCHQNFGKCTICRLPWPPNYSFTVKLLITLALIIVSALPVQAQQYVQLWAHDTSQPYTSANPLPVTLGGAPAGGGTGSVNAAVPNGSHTYTISAACSHLIVYSDSGAADIYVNPFGITATTGNTHLTAGQGVAMDNLPSFTQFSVYGASATWNLNYVAW
jgi:hypothetical protein